MPLPAHLYGRADLAAAATVGCGVVVRLAGLPDITGRTALGAEPGGHVGAVGVASDEGEATVLARAAAIRHRIAVADTQADVKLGQQPGDTTGRARAAIQRGRIAERQASRGHGRGEGRAEMARVAGAPVVHASVAGLSGRALAIGGVNARSHGAAYVIFVEQRAGLRLGAARLGKEIAPGEAEAEIEPIEPGPVVDAARPLAAARVAAWPTRAVGAVEPALAPTPVVIE